MVIHFKDGSTVSVPSGASVVPYPNDNAFVQVFNNLTPPNLLTFVPVCNLEYVDFTN